MKLSTEAPDDKTKSMDGQRFLSPASWRSSADPHRTATLQQVGL